MADQRPWWWPDPADASYFARLRADYPEHTGWSDEQLHEHYGQGAKYPVTWDHVGDAYDQFEKLADAHLTLTAATTALLEAVERVDRLATDNDLDAATWLDLIRAAAALRRARGEA